MSESSPALLRLVDALARRAASDYLTAEVESDQSVAEGCTNPVQLPLPDKAA
jgi:hypothetical protein